MTIGAARCAVDRDFLADVVGVRAGEAACAHDDERLRRQVDVLLVLGDVAGDRLVAELRELDAQLLGRDRVRAVPDDRPVATREHVALRDRGDVVPAVDHGAHRVRQGAQRGEAPVRERGIECVDGLRDRQREEMPGRDLCVERLRRRDAHLDVAPVRREEHTVGLVDQVAVASVHDRDDDRAAGPREIDRAVGVGRGAALADRDDERVGHVVTQREARTARWLESRRPRGARRRAARAQPRGSGPRRPRCPARSR